jgi:PKD repeat protein
VFINYNQNPARWTEEIGEFGDILVIYTSRDATAIQDWITWKKEMGYKVYEEEVSTGTNVVSNISTAYNNNNNLLYVLLVGDWADIKSDLGTSQNAPMDPMMGCVVGSDDYHDIIIGRFSASTTTHVTTQGDKVITYERDPDLTGTWYETALGIASSEGSGIGDDGEADYDHSDNIKNERLIPYHYTTVHEAYQSPANSTVAGYINDGVGLINYTGHGDHDYWVTSSYSASNVNSSTNGDMLPFAFSVACIVGEFHNGSDCLAEAMLRKSGGGAIATWMATINQPWTPPMRGQDYANDILTEGYDYSVGSGTVTDHGKTTFGSITFNAAALMIAESSATDDWDTYETWTVFGDPSVQVRTRQPLDLAVSNPTVTPGTYTTQITVGGSAFENALVSIYQDGADQPASALTDASGNVTIDHSFAGTVKLTVTGYNLATYQVETVVAVPDPPVADFEADQTTVTAGDYVTFSDLSTNYPTSWSWTINGGTPASSTDQNPVVQFTTPGTYTIEMTATNGAGSDTESKTDYITVNPVTNPPVADFEASATTIIMGGTIDFTDLSTNLPSSWSWTFEGGTPGTSTDQNPTSILYDTPGTYEVSLTATNSYGSDTETKSAYITVTPPEYADAGADQEYESINDVIVGDINNTSTGWSTGGYADYTSLTTDMDQGGSYSMTVNINQVYQTDAVKVWVDWNYDGDFDDTDEEVYVSSTNGEAAHTVAIDVPADASIASTRMRIRLWDTDTQYSPNDTPYGSSGYGEVEDYTLNIVSSGPVTPVTDFSGTPTTVTEGNTVAFTDLSTNTPTSWSWTFEGGTPATSTEQSPVITYNTAGTYEVSLTATNAAGSDTETKAAYITVTSAAAPPVAEFEADVTTIEAGQTVNFTDLSTGNPTAWTWTFDGGTPGSSTDQNPASILYDTPGTYDVTLAVTGATGSDSQTKSGYIIVTESTQGDAFTLDFEACTDYSSVFDPWTTVDGDGVTTYQSSDADFTGEGTAFGFMAFNPVDAGFDGVASAHGGDRCGMAICPSDASQSDDWLISDQLTLQTNSSISFWVLSPKPGTWGNDTYKVLVSTTDNNTTSFTDISGTVEAPATWTQHTYDLSAYDGQDVYVAIQHESTDMFIFFIDDIEITTEPGVIQSPAADFTSDKIVVCEGGNITFEDISENTPTSWSWSFEGGTPSTSTSANPTITYNTPGTYEVSLTVTNTGGTDTKTEAAYITVGETPTLGVTSDNALCYGDANGAIDLTVTGGTSPFEYSWSEGSATEDLDAGAGTYTVTVTDGAGCVATISETITEPTQLAGSVSGTDVTCYGECDGTATTDYTGGTAPYIYEWTGGQTAQVAVNLCAGTYDVIITDNNGCTVTESVTIDEPAVLSGTVTVVDETYENACDGSATATPVDGTGPYTYLWSNGGTTQTITGLCNGTYDVTITDECNTYTESVFVNFGLSATELNSETTVEFYPNPNNGQFSIAVKGFNENVTVKVLSISGQEVYTTILNGNDVKEIEAGNLAKGVYTIQFVTEENVVLKKMIIE